MKRAVVWAWSLPEPVRMPSGKCYVSRAVLYAEIGPGPHLCHWCNAEIDWLPKAEPNALEADHLDGDTLNDDPANLVASCRRCNSARGKGVLWLILAYDLVLQQRALDAGPVKTHFRCGHEFTPQNIYALPEGAHSKFVCLTCHRSKALEYWRVQSA